MIIYDIKKEQNYQYMQVE